MPAIQTYQADAVREGHRAYRGEYRGVVQRTGPATVSGALDIRVMCEVHGRPEVWKNIPRHSAVHAERSGT